MPRWKKGENPSLPEHRFKPGQSGNPKGRPKGTTLTNRLKKILAEDDGKVAEALMKAGVKAALKGDYRFWAYIFDRVDGKVADRIAGPEGEGLKIIIEGIKGIEGDNPPASPDDEGGDSDDD